jgi:hypothetical protein
MLDQEFHPKKEQQIIRKLKTAEQLIAQGNTVRRRLPRD